MATSGGGGSIEHVINAARHGRAVMGSPHAAAVMVCPCTRSTFHGNSPILLTAGFMQEYGYPCSYSRQVKKRGRPPGGSTAGTYLTTSTRYDDQSLLGLTRHSDPGNESTIVEARNPSENGSLDETGHLDLHDGSISIPGTNALDQGEQAGNLAVETLPFEPPFLAVPHAYQNGTNVLQVGNAEGSSPADNHRRASARSVVSAESSISARNAECHYPFLLPVLPYIRGIISVPVACELLDIFLTDPGSSLFHGASPFILTRIFRKKSILHPTNPRPTTPALIATILWCVAQTADIMLLHVPGSRSKIVSQLYNVIAALISQRDPDRWRRGHGGLRPEMETFDSDGPTSLPASTGANQAVGTIDDALTFLLLTIAVSGSDSKSDSLKWWSKATRLVLSLRLNREDERCLEAEQPCLNPLCSCQTKQSGPTISNLEQQEERRRVFWLCYSLDRHLALSLNGTLSIPDSCCEVYAPLPEAIWENLDTIPLGDMPSRTLRPPTTASGTTFFEYFLPLMVILGDIIVIHHRRQHPRLGGDDDHRSVLVVQNLLADYQMSLATLEGDGNGTIGDASLSQEAILSMNPGAREDQFSPRTQPQHPPKLHLVRAYGTHILHVLHVLLHGKWDAISMMDDDDDWITSGGFAICASHAISASQTISTILEIDPELTFMSYLFGIYLLHGSFILLLFADRMPQLGPNQSVEHACENIIRAHEVAIVTLNTEFQKTFRKVLRSTLYSVQGVNATNREAHKARRRVLSLYRWTRGGRGLNL